MNSEAVFGSSADFRAFCEMGDCERLILQKLAGNKLEALRFGISCAGAYAASGRLEGREFVEEEASKLQESAIGRKQLELFLSITEKGPLLGNANYEWLDEFKSDCSNLIIDTLMNHTDQCKIETDCELMIRLADTILVFDILHEEAIGMKCKALTALGKHTLAKNAFTKFEKDFQKLYDEPFSKSFSDIIKS